MVLVVIGVVTGIVRGHCALFITVGVSLAVMGNRVTVILAAPIRSGATSEEQGVQR